MYASGIHGKAGLEADSLADDLEPLFETVLRCVPEPRVDMEGPLQMLVSLNLLNIFRYVINCYT